MRFSAEKVQETLIHAAENHEKNAWQFDKGSLSEELSSRQAAIFRQAATDLIQIQVFVVALSAVKEISTKALEDISP